MKYLLILCLFFTSFISVGQDVTWVNPIADETEVVLTPSGKTIRVITSNDKIFQLLTKKFPQYTKLYISNKKDRKGVYQQAVLYYDNKTACKVIEYLKQLK